VRGGLDDALDKLARRDELRRRAEGGGIGTPPAVQDLVEAIAAVVGRNPALAVTVGVEGAGDPVLLHFAVQDGIVQVSADNTVASRVAEAAPTSPRHADFDIDPEEAVQEAYPYSAAPAPSATPETGQATRRISYDDPAFAAYRSGRYADSPFASHRRPEPPDDPSNGSSPSPSGGAAPDAFGSPDPFDATRPLAGSAQRLFGQPSSAFASQATRRIYTQQHRTTEEPTAAERMPDHGPAEQRTMPTPLPKPVPLNVDSAETELAAKRLAALLRDNPTLLRRSHD
jgi:hypothetical protein